MDIRTSFDIFILVFIVILLVLYFYTEYFEINGIELNASDQVLLKNIKQFLKDHNDITSKTYGKYIATINKTKKSYNKLSLYATFKYLMLKKTKGTLNDIDVINLFV